MNIEKLNFVFLGKTTAGLGSGRSRQYSWPSDGATCPNGPAGKNRKKEQNRIASQRFRERRRRALSKSQEEANIYQVTEIMHILFKKFGFLYSHDLNTRLIKYSNG